MLFFFVNCRFFFNLLNLFFDSLILFQCFNSILKDVLNNWVFCLKLSKVIQIVELKLIKQQRSQRNFTFFIQIRDSLVLGHDPSVLE